MEAFNELLRHELLEGIYWLIPTIIVPICPIVILVKAGLIKEAPRWLLIAAIIIIVVILILMIVYELQFYLDLKNESYVVYHGHYKQKEHKGYSTTARDATTLLDGKKKRLVSASSVTHDGEYYGYVVYSKRSKFVVYVGETLPSHMVRQ